MRIWPDFGKAFRISLLKFFLPAGVLSLALSCGVETAERFRLADLQQVSITASTFSNPILSDGADPWIVRHEGFYYYTQTTGHNITIWKSATLSGLARAEKHQVWSPSESGPGSRNIWAPEMHRIGDRWYVYFAADDGNNANHRMYVLESTNDNPLGPYINRGRIKDSTDRWAIDGTVWQREDGLYFVWSGWEGLTDGQQNLYIARMDDPLTISSPRVRISAPTERWEWEAKSGPKVNEGPQILERDGKSFIVYSADQSWTDNYKLGMLTFQGPNPLAASSWKKAPAPVFQSAPEEGTYGPGHNSFIRTPAGEDWILYHAAKSKGSGWSRNIRMQKFGWNPDGSPNFGKPLAAGVPLPMPMGE